MKHLITKHENGAELFFNDTTGNYEFFINGEHQESYYDDGDEKSFEEWLWNMIFLSGNR